MVKVSEKSEKPSVPNLEERVAVLEAKLANLEIANAHLFYCHPENLPSEEAVKKDKLTSVAEATENSTGAV